MNKIYFSFFFVFLICCKSKVNEIVIPDKPSTSKDTTNIKSGFALNTETCSVPCEIKPVLENRDVYRVNWDFGNGITSNEKEPLFYYVFKGTYKLKLMVYNSEGNIINEQIKTIEVKDDNLLKDDYRLQMLFRSQKDKFNKLIWNDTTSIGYDKNGKIAFLRVINNKKNYTLYTFNYLKEGFTCIKYTPFYFITYNSKNNEDGKPFLISEKSSYEYDKDLIYNSNLVYSKEFGFDEYLTEIRRIPASGKFSSMYDRYEIRSGNLVSSTHTGGDGLGSGNDFQVSTLKNNFSTDFYHYLYLTTPFNVGATYDSFVFFNNSKTKYKNLLESKVLSGPYSIDYKYVFKNGILIQIIGNVREDNSVIEINL